MRCLPAAALSLALLPAVSSAQAPAVPPPQVAFPGQYAAPPADRKYPAWPKGCASQVASPDPAARVRRHRQDGD